MLEERVSLSFADAVVCADDEYDLSLFHLAEDASLCPSGVVNVCGHELFFIYTFMNHLVTTIIIIFYILLICACQCMTIASDSFALDLDLVAKKG